MARLRAETVKYDAPCLVAAIVTKLHELLSDNAAAEGEIRLNWMFEDDRVFCIHLTSSTSDRFELRSSNARADISAALKRVDNLCWEVAAEELDDEESYEAPIGE